MIAVLDGKPVSTRDLQALALYNYGHFTSFVVQDRLVKGLDLHLDRLVRDSRALHGVELDPARIRSLARQATGRSDSRMVLRITVFDPDLDFGHPAQNLKPRVLVTSRPAPGTELAPIRLSTAVYARDLPEVKHVGLLATIALRRQAQDAGYDDTAFCDSEQRLSEGATWNLGFIDHSGTIVVPDAPSLAGVTLRLLVDQCASNGIPVQRRTVTVAEAETMPAGFVTNAAVGVRPIAVFNGRDLDGGHPRLVTLQQLYRSVKGEPL